MENFIFCAVNDTSVDIVEDESSFETSPKAEYISTLYVHITLPKDTEAEPPHFLEHVRNVKVLETC